MASKMPAPEGSKKKSPGETPQILIALGANIPSLWGPPEATLKAASVPVDAHYIPRLGHGIDDTGISLGALALQRGFA